MTGINWGPTGELVYNRTYSRVKADGSRETWPETVERVVDGNLALGDRRHELPHERDDLVHLMREFKIIPAGRHLWASGVKGRQYLFNCHVAGWTDDPAEHFRFTFLRLMEGGGVGANYSNSNLAGYPTFLADYKVHIVCDPEHPDYLALRKAGVLSDEFDAEWSGAFGVEDSREGWADALSELFSAYYGGAAHPDRVFDVTRVREEGARLKTFGGRASGPLPLAQMLHEVAGVLNRDMRRGLNGLEAMAIDHAIAKCVVSGGNRRSARMAIMHWNDPQIADFIRVKADTGEHWTTNISVEVDDDFWREANSSDSLASWLLEDIAAGMLSNGEPGIWNSSLSNVGEPNRVTATNPCGEIPLEPWENCNLGHVNLAGFVDRRGNIDEVGLVEAHRLMTRFLIRATNGDVQDDKQGATLARNRRIGVGHFGFASFLAMAGTRYSDAPYEQWVADTLDGLSAIVDDAASEYAHDLRIPVPVKTRTVAPTGTIAKLPGVSEGIHPIFAKYFVRRVRFSDVDEDQRATVEQYRQAGYPVEPCLYAPATSVVSIPTIDSLMEEVAQRYSFNEAETIVQAADSLTLSEMLAVQALYQTHWADNAVSYTANIDPADYTIDDVCNALVDVSDAVKGATVFPDMSMPQAPYERLTRAEFERITETGAWEVTDSVDEECTSGACPVR